VEHWRLAATDTSQDQEEGESENTQTRDARYGAALFHASIQLPIFLSDGRRDPFGSPSVVALLQVAQA
jgi:hypothetical protein